MRDGKNGGKLKSGNIKNVGRPKKLLSNLNEQLKAEGYLPATNGNVMEAFNLLINLDEDRIKAIIGDVSYPMLMRIVAKEMLSKNGAEMIEKILDRAHGKAIMKQESRQVDGEGKDVKPTIIMWGDTQIKV